MFRLDAGSTLPSRATDGSAGYDLSLADGVTVKAGGTATGRTGVHVAIPKGNVGLVFARSSVGAKRHVVLANGTGVIDSDYRGEVLVPLHNYGSEPQSLEAGERIAQMVIVPCLSSSPVMVEELPATGRGTGGFGSTGTK